MNRRKNLKSLIDPRGCYRVETGEVFPEERG
jgi:hypothetical protein